MGQAANSFDVEDGGPNRQITRRRREDSATGSQVPGSHSICVTLGISLGAAVKCDRKRSEQERLGNSQARKVWR